MADILTCQSRRSTDMNNNFGGGSILLRDAKFPPVPLLLWQAKTSAMKMVYWFILFLNSVPEGKPFICLFFGVQLPLNFLRTAGNLSPSSTKKSNACCTHLTRPRTVDNRAFFWRSSLLSSLIGTKSSKVDVTQLTVTHQVDEYYSSVPSNY